MTRAKILPKLTVEDYDTTISTTGLGVVSETHMVTLCARGIAVTMIIKVITAETSVARFHPGELRENTQESKNGQEPHYSLMPGQKRKQNVIHMIDSFIHEQT